MTSNLDQLRLDLKISEMEVGNPMAHASISVDTMHYLEQDRIRAQEAYVDHSDTQSNLLYLQANGKLHDALATAMNGNLDPELAIKAEDLSRIRDEFTHATELGYGPSNPVYLSAQKALEVASNAYEAKIVGIMTGLDALVKHDRRMLDLIASEENRTLTNANLEAITNRAYISLMRDVEVTQRTVDDLGRRYIEEMVEAKQFPEYSVVVHDPARAIKRPVSPKPLLIIPVGVILGLIVGVGMAFFVEYLDTSVKTIDDVERSLQAPVLGVIPQNVGNIMDDGPESPHAEAYRVLRTNLLLGRKNEDWTTITVLSGGAGEGKTTTLFNLAIVFAQNGQRVLLVDWIL